MADYYPLIARAIAGLDPNAPGESRRALYERARTALIAQLRSVQPPLSNPRSPASGCRWKRPSARSNPRPPSAPATPRAGPAPRSGGDAFRRANARAADGRRRPAAAGPAAPRRAAAAAAQRPPAARGATTARRAIFAPTPAPPRPPQPQVPMQDPQLPPTRERTGAPRRGSRTAARHPRRRACAVFATSPPTPTISAAPPRRPTARRAKPTPTCRRPRRNSTGSSPAWRTAAPIRTRPIPMTNPSRRPSATRRRRRPPPPRARVGRRSRDEERARGGTVFPFKSAIAVGVVLILVGAGILWGKSAGDDGQRPVQVAPSGPRRRRTRHAAVEAEDSRSRRPAVVIRPGCAGRADGRAL